MQITLGVGDRVKVVKGKLAGKEDTVNFIDKKSGRVRLESLKRQKIKTKKGEARELHGTFHLTSLLSLKPSNENVPAEPEKKEAGGETKSS